jgi:hypothetical protein
MKKIEAKSNLTLSNNLFLGAILPLITIDISDGLDMNFITHIGSFIIIIGFAIFLKKQSLEQLKCMKIKNKKRINQKSMDI